MSRLSGLIKGWNRCLGSEFLSTCQRNYTETEEMRHPEDRYLHICLRLGANKYNSSLFIENSESVTSLE